MMIQRVQRILVYLSIIGLLSACAGNPPQLNTEANNTVPPYDTDVVTIGFAAQSFERQAYQPLIDAFNQQNPDIRVEFIALDELIGLGQGDTLQMDQIAQQVLQAADTAAAFFVQPQDLERGLISNLAPFIDADTLFDYGDYYPGVLKPDDQGRIAMLPRAMNVELLSYNRTLWNASGFPEPSVDWSWRDVVAAAQQMAQKRSDTVDIYGLVGWDAVQRALIGELVSADAPLLATPPTEARLDEPSVVNALEQVANLISEGALYRLPDQEAGSVGLQKLIDNQQAALWTSGNFVEITVGDSEEEEAASPAFETGFVPMPQLPLPNVGTTDGYIMSSGTQHPDEAWRWLSFISRQTINSSVQFSGASQQVPARRSIADQSGYWEQLDPAMRPAVEAAVERLSEQTSLEPIDLTVLGVLQQALESHLDGTSAQEALVAAQTQLDQQIAETPPDPTPEVVEPFVVTPPETDAIPLGVSTVTFKTIGFDAATIRRLAQAFNEQQTDAFVKVEEAGFGEESQSLNNIAATSDCFAWYSPINTQELTSTLDLQPFFDADASFLTDDYPSALLAPFRSGEALHGLPDEVTLRVLTYNRTLFDYAGIAYPTADWTLDDFLNAAQRLTVDNEQNPFYGFVSQQNPEDLRFFLRLANVQVMRGSGDTLQPNFTDPQVIQAIRDYLALLRTASPHKTFDGYTNDQTTTVSDAFGLTLGGQAGMWFDFGTDGFFVVIDGDSDDKSDRLDEGIAPPPFGLSVPTADDLQTTGLYVSASTSQPQLCWEWLKFISGDVSRYQSTFPARISVAESDAFAGQAQPGAAEVYNTYRELLQRSDVESASVTVPIDYFWFYRAVDRALQGGDLERELANAQELTEQHLDCVGGGMAPAECAKQIDSTYNGIS